ncbi:CinA family protein [Erythrobacter sp.]|jgi:nicotinamide-nucleotide amidase|uniref:CinA family protein n=1 Tax=Erythrobacteraceae TaxID=335929 RepID=UPI001B0229A4|nr:CinA family protein [Erythrobacter sp.]MBO6526066.1 CinA family protein [Erythrobacter sp.]MBO6531140.1 CinA family protein [Erythrobacter sp.]MBO6768593.1 CinA family protein [Erythrobacter sp.]
MPLEALLPEDIDALAKRVVEENTAAGRKVVLAESCTGGLVAAALTEIAGSSAVLDRGFVTYSNESKMECLDVSLEIIETFGAVSIACAWAMAKGALEKSNADVAVAISGVAGPGGGTDLKPVGTVVFARVVRGEDGEPEGELKLFDPTTRADIRRKATICALELLLP